MFTHYMCNDWFSLKHSLMVDGENPEINLNIATNWRFYDAVTWPLFATVWLLIGLLNSAISAIDDNHRYVYWKSVNMRNNQWSRITAIGIGIFDSLKLGLKMSDMNVKPSIRSDYVIVFIVRMTFSHLLKTRILIEISSNSRSINSIDEKLQY